jgi:hypothetical protein
MLGEHDWWGKLRMPFFNEIANIPMMIHDPSVPESWGNRVDALTQVLDLSPTLLDLFDLEPCHHSTGKSMLPLLRREATVIRDIALFGVFGGALNSTNGRYTYFLYPHDMEDKPLFEYTLMPMHSTSMFEIRELKNAELVRGFDFAKGAPVLKVPALSDAKRPPMQGGGFAETHTRLYDLETDPRQDQSFRSAELESLFNEFLRRELEASDAPAEIYSRFSLQK